MYDRLIISGEDLSDLGNSNKLEEEDGGISENWVDAVKALDEIIEELLHYNIGCALNVATLLREVHQHGILLEARDGHLHLI